MPQKPKHSKAGSPERFVDDIRHAAETGEIPAERESSSLPSEDDLVRYWSTPQGKKKIAEIADQLRADRTALRQHLGALEAGQGKHREFYTQVLSEKAEHVLAQSRLLAKASSAGIRAGQEREGRAAGSRSKSKPRAATRVPARSTRSVKSRARETSRQRKKTT
jgi:hypothetical protein